MDTFVDAHLQFACVYDTISKHANSSIANDVNKLVRMANQNKIENDVVQFVVDECKMKVPIGAHMLKAQMLAAMNCPAVQYEMKQSRKLDTDDSGNTVCTSPCPSGTNCGTCSSQCTTSTVTSCSLTCASAIAMCSFNIASCYDSILSCLDTVAGCCACGAEMDIYTCGCC